MKLVSPRIIAPSAPLAVLRILALAVAVVGAAPMWAQAQGPAILAARTQLATYDLSGGRTLDALRSLGPVVASGGADAREAGYLRSLAATDVHVAALALADAALDARLADAIGVPPAQLGAELRAELTAIRAGVYRAAVDEEIALLTEAEHVSAGAFRIEGTGARRSALYLLATARASSNHAQLAAIRVGSARTAPTWFVGPDAGLQFPVEEALGRYDAATRGVRDGDPLIVALASALDAARTTLLAFEMRVPPSTVGDASIVLATGDAAGSDTPDVLLVVAPTRVDVACGAHLRASSASALDVHLPSPACPELGALRTLPLPSPLPAVPQAIDTLVAAFTALALPSGTVIAIATTETTPMHVVTRVLRSLARANVTPTLFALRAGDQLGTSPIRLATTADAPSLTVHVRLGGFAIERTHGRDSEVPRIHGASGLAYDHAGLVAALRAETGSHVVAVDGMGTVPAAEVIRALRILASAGAQATLALP